MKKRIKKKKELQLMDIATGPCPNANGWTVAPKPTHNPLENMEWANGTQKDKFGCTRNGGNKFHAGIDIKAEKGTDCFATEDSKVTEVGFGTEVGTYVAISYKKGSKTYGVAYCHLSKTSVTKNQQIKAGDKIGETGRSGNVPIGDQSHLHLEVQDQVWVAYDDAEERSNHSLNPNNWI